MGGIINREKLARIREDIDALRARNRNIRSDDLVSIAKALGRERDKKRTNHPTYVTDLLPRNPISIPKHPGTLKVGTAMNILDDLEADVDGLLALLDERDRKYDAKKLPTKALHQSRKTR